MLFRRYYCLKDGELVKVGTKDEVIQEEVLSTLYDMDLSIENIRGQRICIYFDELTTGKNMKWPCNSF